MVSGAWVLTGGSRACDGESSETDKADFATFFQGSGNRVKYRVNRLGGVGFGKTGAIGDGRNQIILIQGKGPLFQVD